MRTLYFVTLILALASTIAHAGICSVPNVGSGACLSTSSCSSNGGTSHDGYCSDEPGTQCCTGIPCDSDRGTCMQTSLCTGTVKTGLCPGPTGFACCVVIKTSGSGAAIVAAAEAMVGKYPYSWGGGNNNGPSTGILQTSSPNCDDRNVVGFDCSGLAKYAVYQGTGISLDHDAQVQYENAPKKVPYEDKLPGDLVFFGATDADIYHVGIYVGDEKMVDSSGHFDNCTGKPVGKRTIYSSGRRPNVARYWKEENITVVSSSSSVFFGEESSSVPPPPPPPPVVESSSESSAPPPPPVVIVSSSESSSVPPPPPPPPMTLSSSESSVHPPVTVSSSESSARRPPVAGSSTVDSSSGNSDSDDSGSGHKSGAGKVEVAKSALLILFVALFVMM